MLILIYWIRWECECLCVQYSMHQTGHDQYSPCNEQIAICGYVVWSLSTTVMLHLFITKSISPTVLCCVCLILSYIVFGLNNWKIHSLTEKKEMYACWSVETQITNNPYFDLINHLKSVWIFWSWGYCKSKGLMLAREVAAAELLGWLPTSHITSHLPSHVTAHGSSITTHDTSHTR